MLADSGWGRAHYLELISPDRGRLMRRSKEQLLLRDVGDDLKVRRYLEAVGSDRGVTGKVPQIAAMVLPKPRPRSKSHNRRDVDGERWQRQGGQGKQGQRLRRQGSLGRVSSSSSVSAAV